VDVAVLKARGDEAAGRVDLDGTCCGERVRTDRGDDAVIDQNGLFDDSGRREDVASGDQQADASSNGVIP